jgi:VanZ family protein
VSGSMASKTLSRGRVASLLLPPLVVMGVIFFLSAQPSTGHYPLLEVLLRKLAHVTEYLVLTLCWWRALRGFGVSPSNRVLIVLAFGLALAYSGTDEFHQTFVSGRHGTPVDVLIDSIGMTIAAAIATRTESYARRRSLGPSRPSAA